MAPPPVPLPIMRVACPPRELPAVPGPAQAPVTPPAPDRETKPGPAVAVAAAPVEVINPAPAPVTLTVLVPVISPAVVVGTRSRFRGE
jgi:hypothetical protein